MMQMFDVVCTSCKEVNEVFDKLIGFDVPCECPSCGETAFRAVSNFAYRGMESTTLLDGQKRAGWSELQESFKLEELAENEYNPTEKHAILTEANRVHKEGAAKVDKAEGKKKRKK